MQDRYAGDVGDFGKYGLLRRLCCQDAHGPALRLGVLWYFFKDRTPGDGRHVDYLKSPRAVQFRKCDPDLFEQMQSIVRNERSVEAVEVSGALPTGTVFFRKKLIFCRAERPRERCDKRRDWLEEGLARVADAEVVFVDPDNGFEIPNVGRLSLKGPKYAYYDDLRPCWSRGQSLVVYQHIGRKGTAEKQITARLATLCERFEDATAAFALRYRRGTSRAYFVIPAPEHAERLTGRRKDFLTSPWSQHFESVA